MSGRSFDDLARTLAEPMPRRRALRLAGAAMAATALPMLRPRRAGAQDEFCFEGKRFCPSPGGGGNCCPNTWICEPDGQCFSPCPEGMKRCGGPTGGGPCCPPDQICEASGGPGSQGGFLCVPKPCPDGFIDCEGGECCPLGYRCVGGGFCECSKACGGCCPPPTSLCCGSGSNTYCCGPEQAKRENKEICGKYAQEWDDFAGHTALTAAAAGVGAAKAPVLATVAAWLGANAAVATVAKNVLANCEQDPPDRRYRSIARPPRRSIPSIPTGPGVTSAGARALRAVVAKEVAAYNLIGVWVTSLERAQGAVVAGSQTWARRQTLAAADHASRAAKALGQARVLRTQARRQLSIQEISFTAEELANAQRQVAASGLPAAMKAFMRSLGIRSAQITELERRTVALDPARLAGPVFPSGVNKAATIRRSTSLAPMLRSYSARAKRTPLRRVAAKPRRVRPRRR